MKNTKLININGRFINDCTFHSKKCDVCGERTDFLVDYFANICQDCKRKYTDMVLLKRIGELIEENKKLIKENEKLSMRPIRRIRYPQDFKDKFKWRPKPISIR